MTKHVATLVVDLDGTLLDSDFLVECAFIFLRDNPLRLFLLFSWLLRGKAYLKSRLAESTEVEVEALPYNHHLLEWLKQCKAAGYQLVLATATHERYANAIAKHLGLFDVVYGTTGTRNLSSHQKRELLLSEYGEGGFEYVANARADLPIWQVASAVHVVNPEWGVLSRARKLGKVGEVFQTLPGYAKTLFKALRLHQWVKNILIFVPLAASHKLLEGDLLIDGLLAFILFGLCASSVYLLNDLVDLPDDRHHPTKQYRPLASGALPIKHALVLAPVMLLAAFGIGFWLLPLGFSAALLAYYLLTVAYSFRIKQLVMLDVITLALLYSLRIIAGTSAFQLPPSFWILAFSLFIFLSLAFLKRYTELYDARSNERHDKTPGRGYYPQDFELLASLGGASGFVSVLILALYINEISASTLYHHPEVIWLSCPLLLYWISRAWLLAHRGQMHDDPVVFALKDPVSRWVGVLFAAVFIVAS